MNLAVVGLNFDTAALALRERLAFSPAQRDQALAELNARYGCEAAVLSTCNRVELYLARPDTAAPIDEELIAEFIGEERRVPTAELRPALYVRRGEAALNHLCRVASSLDSLVVGEAQIAGQVKEAYEAALAHGATGPLLNAAFQAAQRAGKRVRTETGIADGHVSISSVAVDFVREVFDRFDDKCVLIIGAGKMGRLTLKHLVRLGPREVIVTNRSLEKAQEVAAECGGVPAVWDRLDDLLARADIVLSTTGSPEPIVTAGRYNAVRKRRGGGRLVVLDIAVPRDFDPSIHDGDRTCLFDIDDLKRVREQTLESRRGHIADAESVIAQEVKKFIEKWHRDRNGPVIRDLQRDCDAKRAQVVKELLAKLDGKLDERDIKNIEGAFRLFQNRLLHGPISALNESSKAGGHSSTVEALRRMFRLGES